MAASFRHLFLLIAFLGSLLGSSYGEDDQVGLLLRIKSNLQDPKNALHNWENNTPAASTPCHWNGIICNNASLVTAITLDNAGLRGTLPSSLCGLNTLRAIQLGQNSLYGSIAGVFWNNCSQLEILNLTTNSLTGSLPDFSALSSLQVLDLSKNSFSGKFPLSVANLSSLLLLNLNDNPLDPSFIPQEIYSLKGLSILSLSNCSLIGTISPSIGNLTELLNLELSYNNLRGMIPKEITSLTKLYQLELYNNFLAGEIPLGFRNLNSLKYLDASQNLLNGTLSELAGLKNLVSLQFYRNQLSGSIPNEFGEFRYLRDLSLYTNRLTGPVPPKLGSLSEFSAMDISENGLTGALPQDACKRGKLEFFLALQNSFTGGIPESYGNCSTLIRFRVSNNSLSGTVPSGIWGLPNAYIIDLSDNNFVGEIGREIKYAKNLSVFTIQNNNFSGSIPSEIGHAKNLYVFTIQNNNFSGSIPSEIGQALFLGRMDASNNKLSGELPSEIGDLSELNSLLLEQNTFSGTVPSGIWGLPDAYIIDLSDNNFVGEIGREIKYAKNLSVFTIQNNNFSGSIPSEIGQALLLGKMDASNNKLSGELPSEIGDLSKLSSLLLQQNTFSGPIPNTIGLCKDLSEINLAGNKLNGPILESFGSIQVLNSLNLSNNQLSGQIPTTLSSLQLSLLDFSFNQLTGPVPTQLISLASKNSFSGNIGLCVNGAKSDLLRSCASSSLSSRSKSHVRILIASFMSAAAVVIFVIGWIRYKKMYKIPESLSWDLKSFDRLRFSEDDILRCLKEENTIGSGGSGKVYKGEISSGEKFAVKQLWISNAAKLKLSREETVRNRQFEMEVETLGCIRHRNIVKLYCCLSNRDSNLIVYEYMKNGSLWSRLHEQDMGSILDWQARYKIALGTAYGLAYLHHDCVPAIVHRDVKSSNILLDDDLEPRLADFGVAKCLQACGNGDSTAIIAGTHGYIAPEYAYTYKVNEKSDVYSFGVVLMELVSGKRPMEVEYGESKGIVHWISRKIVTTESAFEVLDKRVSDFNEEGMVKVLKIAVLCTSDLTALRPCMRDVTQILCQADPCLGSSPSTKSSKLFE